MVLRAGSARAFSSSNNNTRPNSDADAESLALSQRRRQVIAYALVAAMLVLGIHEKIGDGKSQIGSNKVPGISEIESVADSSLVLVRLQIKKDGSYIVANAGLQEFIVNLYDGQAVVYLRMVDIKSSGTDSLFVSRLDP